MIAAELRGGNKPSLNEALGWIGSRVDDIYGAAIGRLEDVWIDPGTGAPRWLLVKEGRFGGRSTLVPFGDATAGAGHVWVPYERDVVREAPQIEPGAPLTQQVEATLRNHYAANASTAVAQGARSARDPRRAPQAQQAPQPQAVRPPEQGGTRATVRLAAEPAPEPVPPPRMPDRPPPPVTAPREQPPAPDYGYEAPAPPQVPPEQPYAYNRPEPPPQQQYAYRQPPAAYPYQPPPQQQAPPPPPPAPDPLAILSSLPPGQMIEIELSGTLTISGELRHIRIVPPEGGTGYPG
ncbi:MAG: PRC-barrel domain-containing protein [Solirubrobacterales bacterium]